MLTLVSMESSHLVIFSTSGKFITKFNVLRCISFSETLFWTGARGRVQSPFKDSLPYRSVFIDPIDLKEGLQCYSSFRKFTTMFDKDMLCSFPSFILMYMIFYE